MVLPAEPCDKSDPALGALSSVLIWACIVFVTALTWFALSLVFLISLPFDRTGAWPHRIGAEWGRTIVRLVPGWRVRMEGLEHLRRGPYVIVANHQSQVDILAAFFLPHHFKWLSKRSMFSIPFFGWMMRMCRYIPVQRGGLRSIEESLRVSESWIRRGVSVLFFPEGTRSHDGRLQSFKSGAFRVAASTGVPVLPVVIVGTASCLPKNSWRFGRRGDFRLVVGPAIPSAGVSVKKAPDFAADVRRRFEELKWTVESGATGAA